MFCPKATPVRWFHMFRLLSNTTISFQVRCWYCAGLRAWVMYCTGQGVALIGLPSRIAGTQFKNACEASANLVNQPQNRPSRIVLPFWRKRLLCPLQSKPLEVKRGGLRYIILLPVQWVFIPIFCLPRPRTWLLNCFIAPV